jgi:hypothetical protein
MLYGTVSGTDLKRGNLHHSEASPLAPATESQTEAPYTPCNNMDLSQTKQGKGARLATSRKDSKKSGGIFSRSQLWSEVANMVSAGIWRQTMILAPKKTIEIS